MRKQNELVEESIRAETEEPQRRDRKGDSRRRSYVADAYLNNKLLLALLQVKFGAFHRLNFRRRRRSRDDEEWFIYLVPLSVCARLGEMIFLIIVMWKHVAGDQIPSRLFSSDLIVWRLQHRAMNDPLAFISMPSRQPRHLERLARNLGAGAFVA